MPRTTKEIDSHKLSSYRPWATMECYREDPEVSKRREDAWKLARVVSEMLKRRYGATRVVVFGSLTGKTGFTPWSDIDLAAWGIAPEDYYLAAGTAMDIGLEEGTKVDVVDPGDCGPQFLLDIEQEGVEL
jgi:predicted nucleotidyltransferase